MNTKLFIRGLVVVCALSMLFSCEDKREVSGNSVGFDTININRVYHLNNDSTQPSCNLKIQFVYPSSYEDNEILAQAKKGFLLNMFGEDYANLTPEETVDRYAENYINNYKEDAKIFFKEKEMDFIDHDASDNYFSYYETLSNEIKFNKADIISFRISQSNFKGGRNSFQQYGNFAYDLNSNKILTENDIFKDGYEKALNVVFKSKLLTANKAENIHKLEDLGYFGIEEIMPNDNFLLDENGITYTFNKGEYSALQLDEINISIAYKEIEPILKENSPVSVFLTK